MTETKIILRCPKCHSGNLDVGALEPEREQWFECKNCHMESELKDLIWEPVQVKEGMKKP